MTTSKWAEPLALVAAGLVVLATYALLAERGPALVDEYLYLANARHFSETGSLNARFYNATALLNQGYPHQDMHAPGYVLLLGAAMWLLGPGYGTAVALNAVAYLAGALLLRDLASRLGCPRWAALGSGALFLLLPPYPAYVFWAMPEVLVGVTVLLLLALAARVRSLRGAAAAGAVAGLGLVLRESIAFALPAAAVAVEGRSRRAALFGTLAAMALFVYLPLSQNRGEGGTNFWRVTSEGSAFEFGAAQAGASGRLGTLLARARDRTSETLALLLSPRIDAAERGVLLAFGGLMLLPLLSLRAASGPARRVYFGLLAGALGLWAAMFGFFQVPPWSAPRYVMLMGPPFLVWAALPPFSGRRALVLPAALALAFLGLDVAVQRVFDRYIEVRRRRQESNSDYLERYIPPGARRVFANDAYLFGWRRYPVEVVVVLPTSQQLRALDDQLGFDYVVLPADWPGLREFNRPRRFQLVNGDDEGAEVRILRRIQPASQSPEGRREAPVQASS